MYHKSISVICAEHNCVRFLCNVPDYNIYLPIRIGFIKHKYLLILFGFGCLCCPCPNASLRSGRVTFLILMMKILIIDRIDWNFKNLADDFFKFIKFCKYSFVTEINQDVDFLKEFIYFLLSCK